MVESEATKNLAVRKSGISLDASIRSLIVLVEDIESIDISWGELRTVNALKEACCLVKTGNIRAADISATVSGLNSAVLPTLDFNNSHKVFKSHISGSSFSSSLFDVKTLGSKSVV